MIIGPTPPPLVLVQDPLDHKSKNVQEEDQHRRVVDEPQETQETQKSRQSLDPKQEQQLQDLKQRDREVRAHEAAHKNRAGPYGGATHFSFQIGPDGKRYAIGGEVSIDMSAIPNNPEATLQKAETIRAAALAPKDPSSQDHAIAAKAQQMATEARAEIQKKNLESYEDAESSPAENPFHAKV